MRVRRLIPALCACLVASVSIAAAQPKGTPKKDPKAPATPAKGAPKGGAPAEPPKDAPKDAPKGEVVQMTEDAPPKDIEGRDENPDAPRIIGEPPPAVEKPAAAKRPPGYPIEETLRPLTLPKNMSEVSLAPHAQISPYRGADALRARYGITDQIQLGLTYVLGGIYDDPVTMNDKIGFHPGKAVGLDLTVQLKDWIAVRGGVPVYIDPLAVAVTLGAPMKWQFADGKFSLTLLDDLLNIRVYRFAPSFYQEYNNALGAAGTGPMGNNTQQSSGELRFTGTGVMQNSPKTAFFGRVSVIMEDFKTTKDTAGGGLITSLRAGVQHTPRKYLDIGGSLGFEDLAHPGTIAPQLFAAIRI